MHLLKALTLIGGILFAAGCSSASETGCGSEEANTLVQDLIKEEVQFGTQRLLDAREDLGSFDVTALESAVANLTLSLSEVRSSRDDPGSERMSCRATLKIEVPEEVESEADEARSLVEMDTVRELANVYRLSRDAAAYTTDFDYFIQPTDDGEKLFAEVDPDDEALQFITEVFASYLSLAAVREERIAMEQQEAAIRAEELAQEREEQAMEREIDEAQQARADAALNSARIERQLASENIGAVWAAMPRGAQLDLDELHSAWVREMNARCAAEAAGSDPSRSMRQARELNCQTRLVRSCASTLSRNTSWSNNWSYCRF